MSSSFGRKSPSAGQSPQQASHQGRVNDAMFSAIERLGSRLQKTETERDHLSERLEHIESSAQKDEKTGQYFLPVIVKDGALPAGMVATPSAPKWMMASSMLSGVLAIASVFVVLSGDPALTPEQLQALNTFADPQFVRLAEQRWSPVVESVPHENKLVDLGVESVVGDGIDVVSLFEPSMPEVTETVPDVVEVTNVPEQIEPVAEVVTLVQEPVTETEQVAVVVETEQAIETPEVVEPVAEVADVSVVVEPVVQEVVSKDVSNKATPVEDVSENYGIEPDKTLPTEIAELERRAFEGVAEAQHDLGTLYAAGEAVQPDFERAAYWFREAANRGVANAHYNLGVMYHQGLGVNRDLKQALAWYHNASELGHPEALYNLGIAYVEGIGTKVDVNRGVSFFKRAAHAGVAQAAYNLGILYESSFVGGEDKGSALEWYTHAASLGHADASHAVQRIVGKATPPPPHNIVASLASDIEPASGNDDLYSKLIKDIQTVLVEQHMLPGQADGVMTPQTEDAIRNFQKQAGMPTDGRASQALLDFMLYAGGEE